MHRYFKQIPARWWKLPTNRRGNFVVVGSICMVAAISFMALAVDIGVASLTKSKMQSAVDSAALAAASEISIAIQSAGPNVSNIFTYAQQQAQAKGAYVAQLNNVYVNASTDVAFGRRYFNPTTQSFVIDWNAGANQTNVVQVTARRTGTTTSAPDGMLPSLFGSSISAGTSLQTQAIAFINPRDLVIVQDFSRSMNFDSYFTNEVTTGLTQAQIEACLAMVWSDLQPLTLGTMTYTPQYFTQSQTSSSVTGTVSFQGTSVAVTSTTGLKSVKLTFASGSTQTISVSGTTTKSGTYAGTSGNASSVISSVALTSYKVGSTSQTVTLPTHSCTTATIMTRFGLTTSNYPFAGGSWSDYISYVQSSSSSVSALPAYGYQNKFGGITFLCYIMKNYPEYSSNNALWKTRHYPFQACKDGQTMLCNYLASLGFDDNLGMVSYDTSHRVETTINDPNPAFPHVNLSATPMSTNYTAIAQLMQYKQAANYSYATNMGGGMTEAINLLTNYGRPGATPQIILMTDGHSNTVDSGVSTALPSGWDWNKLFDYNGDGVADYTSTDPNVWYVLAQVQVAVNKGYKVHAVSVGSVADRPMMQAAAWLGKGYWLDVPAGTTVADMSTQMQDAFALIAADVPPARLVNNGN